jgi:hypothetical protein
MRREPDRGHDHAVLGIALFVVAVVAGAMLLLGAVAGLQRLADLSKVLPWAVLGGVLLSVMSVGAWLVARYGFPAY